MPNFLKRLSRSIRGFSHRQALTRLRDDLHFVPTVIYDIGAHQARWTTVARGIFPDSQYFLFEANPDNAEVLQASKERHFIATLSFADGIECDFFVPRANISTT